MTNCIRLNVLTLWMVCFTDGIRKLIEDMKPFHLGIIFSVCLAALLLIILLVIILTPSESTSPASEKNKSDSELPPNDKNVIGNLKKKPRAVYIEGINEDRQLDDGPTWNVPPNFQIDILEGASYADKRVPDEKFMTEVLNAHNMYRERHGVEPLIHSKQLVQYASQWASHLAYYDQGLTFRPNNRYGENVYVFHPLPKEKYPTGKKPVVYWYSDITKYMFGAKEQADYHRINGFAQVVWKKSLELGCAQETNEDSKATYVVCNYNPPGKAIGAYLHNVGRPKNVSFVQMQADEQYTE